MFRWSSADDAVAFTVFERSADLFLRLFYLFSDSFKNFLTSRSHDNSKQRDV